VAALVSSLPNGEILHKMTGLSSKQQQQQQQQQQ